MFTRDAIVAIVERTRTTLAEAGDRFPATADVETGAWDWSDDGAWLGGYWPALLWQCARVTGEEEFAEAALAASARLGSRAHASTVLRGMLFWYGAGLGAALGFLDEDALGPAKVAADALIAAVDPVVGAIPPLSEDSVYGWPRPGVAVDAMAGTVPLLAWAGRPDLATGHARSTMRLCARPDGSLAQVATYDEAGVRQTRASITGTGPDSTVAGAQAWGMLGLAQAARLDPTLEVGAVRAADWWLDHVPADGVARWDFDAPDDQPVDTAATAVAASALMHLGRIEAAERLVAVLEAEHLGPAGGLRHGCLNYPAGIAVGSELIWGDYFLLEAAIGIEPRIEQRIESHAIVVSDPDAGPGSGDDTGRDTEPGSAAE